MTNKELQNYLAQFPDKMPVKICVDQLPDAIDFTTENIFLTTETAYIDADAPMDDWDHEEGKIELGDGQKLILINPLIY